MENKEAKDILYRDEKRKREEDDYRNSLLGELKGKLTPAQILYSSTDKLENIKNEFSLKNKKNSDKSAINYDDIENDNTLSKEEKLDKLKQRKEEIDKKITTQDALEKGKIIGLGALEAGSMAIPSKGAIKIGGKIGEKILRKYTGKAIGKAAGEGTAAGAVAGGAQGAIEAVKDKKSAIDVAKDTAMGTAKGAAAGAVAGTIGAKAEKVVSAKVLENAPDMKTQDSEAKKIFRRKAKKYYQDYIQGTKVKNKDIGDIEFTQKGAGETTSKDINTGKTIPKLKKNIEKAKKTETKKPYKNRKDNAEQFHTLENDKEKYIIVQDEKGQKYYMTKTKEEALENNKKPNILEKAKNILYRKNADK